MQREKKERGRDVKREVEGKDRRRRGNRRRRMIINRKKHKR